MKISDYAKHLLFSEKLEDKLFPPLSIWDEETESKPIRIEKPNRQSSLQFSDKKIKIPRLEHLNQVSAKGLTLHHFANHELMAIELFAFALLAFPEVPYRVKLGFLKTIRDEQLHLKMYLDRMHDFGIEFGEIPVNYLFWKQISRMDTIQKFCAIMSISFEGANLDFSQIYAQAFLQHGDLETARIMLQIFEDEIHHVKRGLLILKNDLTPEQNEWDYYLSLLEFPFTPRRAKGYFYFPQTRKLAGLSDLFCEELGHYSDEYTGRVNLNGLGKLKMENQILRKSDLQDQKASF